MLVCAFLCAYCTRDRGCSAPPAFPAPSDFRWCDVLENLARIGRRDREAVCCEGRHNTLVMPGLVPGIHVLCSARKDVDGRDKPGHDGVNSQADVLPSLRAKRSNPCRGAKKESIASSQVLLAMTGPRRAPSFRDAPLGAGPESITTIGSMDSLMCNCTSKLVLRTPPMRNCASENDKSGSK